MSTVLEAGLTVAEKFAKTREELADCLIERESEIDLILTALACQEHVLLVGPPGTGKSMLADALVNWMHGTRFDILVSKFSTPEEFFGPISVIGLKSDQYRRITTGKLPDAEIAFIDEIFKASSAILNTTLKILNERRFQNDSTVIACPLKLCIGASNEWPGDQEGGKELGALFDRFLFRKTVKPVGTEKGLNRLFWEADLTPNLSTSITPAEIDTANLEVDLLPWTGEAKDAFVRIHREAKREGITPGDRRLRKAVTAAQGYAWVQGAAAVEPDHLEILGHVLWDDPQEQSKKLAEIVGQIANPSGMKVNSLLMEAEDIGAKIDMKDMGKVAMAVKKLSEIEKQLNGMPGEKATKAAAYVKDKSKQIKLATVEGL